MDDVLIYKAQTIERCIKRVQEEYIGFEDEINTNFTKQDAIILNIERACQACIDMGNHFVKTHKLGIPQSSKDVFQILFSNKIIENELNKTLKNNNITVGKFKTGDTPVDRLLGKEMILLLWAIEDSDPTLIPTAIRNWLGFSREERWWLFTMTNATTGHADDKRGWRKAIRYAITENPIDDLKTNQMRIFDL